MTQTEPEKAENASPAVARAKPPPKVAQLTPKQRRLRILEPLVESGSQSFSYTMNVRGTYPDGRVYSGTGFIRLTNDQHTRRAQYTVTFDTITYRGTALVRGCLKEKNLVLILDYHERPYHKGMAVSIHEQDPTTGQLKGRILFQGRSEIGEETITIGD